MISKVLPSPTHSCRGKNHFRNNPLNDFVYFWSTIAALTATWQDPEAPQLTQWSVLISGLVSIRRYLDSHKCHQQKSLIYLMFPQ